MIINSSPNNWQNVYNEMVFGLESTNATAAGFQFLVDINVNGQTNPVARLTYPKQPNINTVDVDVSEVLRQYVSYDFASYNASGLHHCINSKVDYWVEFGEVRNNASGIPVIYPNLSGFYASGNNAHSTNAIFDFLDWSKSAFIDYDVNSPIESGLTLNQTTYQEKLRYGEERFLTFFDWGEYGTGIVGNLNIQLLDKNLNVLLQSNKSFTPIGSINSINVANSGNASGIPKTVYDAAFTNASAVYYRVNGQNEYNNYLTSPTNLTNAAWGKDAGVTFTHYANGGFANQPYDNYTNNSNTGGSRVYQELTTLSQRPFPIGTYSVYLRGSGTVRLGIYQSPTNPTTEFQLTNDWKLYQFTRNDLIDAYMTSTLFFDGTSINCDICLSNFGNAPTTYFSRTFLIDTSCQKYSPIRLQWLNNLGGFDAYTFTKVSRNFTDIERKMFKKFQPLNYPKTFRAKTNYFTKLTDTIQINSDGLTDAEWIGLKELVLSPVVMMEYGATYIPVNIKESNYEEKQYINDRQISSLQLTIEYTFDNYRQSL